jgi:hypothetical protein
MRVIVRASLVAQTMHELNIAVRHHGRASVGGIVIPRDAPERNENLADCSYRSVIAESGLEIVEVSRAGLLPRDALVGILAQWALHDDPAYHAKCNLKSANSRVSARLTVPSFPMMGGLLDGVEFPDPLWM